MLSFTQERAIRSEIGRAIAHHAEALTGRNYVAFGGALAVIIAEAFRTVCSAFLSTKQADSIETGERVDALLGLILPKYATEQVRMAFIETAALFSSPECTLLNQALTAFEARIVAGVDGSVSPHLAGFMIGTSWRLQIIAIEMRPLFAERVPVAQSALAASRQTRIMAARARSMKPVTHSSILKAAQVDRGDFYNWLAARKHPAGGEVDKRILAVLEKI
jgi:hypothetical protein